MQRLDSGNNSADRAEPALPYACFRLSARQIALIRPGIALIFGKYNIRISAKRVFSSYRVRNIRQPSKKRLGKYDEFMMRQVLSVWRSVRSGSRSGLRLRLNTLQIRACILGLRIQQEARRDEERWARARDEEGRKRAKLNNRPPMERLAEHRRRRAALAKYQKLVVDSGRVISTLERHMKVANRRLRAGIGKEESQSLVARWDAHLRWMRCHLVYYQPQPPICGRKLQRLMIDSLVKLATEGLAMQGYKVLDNQRLRVLVRRAFRYHREGRTGRILTMAFDHELRRQLSDFILSQEYSRWPQGADQDE